MEPIENEVFLSRFNKTDEHGYILVTERYLIDNRLNDLAEAQKKIVQEKKDVAEQSGDNWHDGAFIATDNAANAVQSQAAAMFKARMSTVVQLPAETEQRVTIGSTVTVKQSGLPYKLMIVGMASLYHLNNDIEVCSVLAPLARAIIGTQCGESVIVNLNKKEQTIDIIDVDQLHAQDFLELDTIKKQP